jgi:hypothetical protein
VASTLLEPRSPVGISPPSTSNLSVVEVDPVCAAPTNQPSAARPRRHVDLLAIAEGFAVSAADIPELANVTERRWVLLAATDLFEAWAIGWPSGGKIELHDHGASSGAIVVARGSLFETTFRPTSHGVAVVGSHDLHAGDHRSFGHDSDECGVSVHVYGPKLSTMTYYRLSGTGRLNAVRTEDVEPVGPFDVTRDHDPS